MGLTGELGNTTQGLPFTLFIDRGGRLRATKVGLISEPEVERQLGEIL
jgi:hypothetical protein